MENKMYLDFENLNKEQIEYLVKIKVTNEDEYLDFINWIDSVMTTFINWEKMENFKIELDKLVKQKKEND